jgi:phospholipase C
MALTISELREAVGTIVILMMENRSFDNLLGHLSFNGNRADVDGVRGPNLSVPAYVNPANGQGYSPFLMKKDGDLDRDLPHDKDSVQKQLSFIAASQSYGMNGFAQAYLDQGGSMVADLAPLGFLDGSLVPMSSWLAENFTICDRWFSSVPTSTHPNKLMTLAGKSTVDDTATFVPRQDTLLDWLTARNIDWRVYHDGAFSFFSVMPQYWPLMVGDRFRRFNRMQGDLHNDTTPPQVIIIEPAYGDSPLEQHPNDNHPPLAVAFGENFVLQVYRSLLSAPPAVLSRTVMIAIHDEHGGFWDHVPPHPTPGFTSLTGHKFDTTGPRVPAFVVSPLVSARRVVHDLLFDHTSILQFVAECFAPGGGSYSHEVDLRESYGFSSVSAALDLSAPRPLPPAPNITVTAPITLQTLRPVQTAGQRAFAHAIDGILSSPFRAEMLAKIPELNAWDAG